MRTREEQIAQLKHFLNNLCPDLQPSGKQALAAVAKNFIEEAEQRVRAEIGRDSVRLDWLQQHAAHVEDVSIHCIMTTDGDTSFSLGGRYAYNLREAIDAARNGGE